MPLATAALVSLTISSLSAFSALDIPKPKAIAVLNLILLNPPLATILSAFLFFARLVFLPAF